MDQALLEDQHSEGVDQVPRHGFSVRAVGHLVQVRDLPAFDEDHGQNLS